MSSLIIEAARFAEFCHRGQTREYNGRPYITHPCRVAGRAMTHPLATEEFVAAACLHDVMEDCGVTFDELVKRFNSHVADIVYDLTDSTKEQMPTANRRARKAAYAEDLSNASREARVLKLLDRIDNLSEMTGCDPDFEPLYKEESVLLAKALRGADEQLYMELMELCK